MTTSIDNEYTLHEVVNRNKNTAYHWVMVMAMDISSL